jgi:hypothetical protein
MTTQVQAGNWSNRNAKGRERPEGSSQSPPKAGTKSFNGIMKQFQIRNPTKLMEALASVGMRTFPQEHPNAGNEKGKGKNRKGKSNPDNHPPSPKGAKAKGKGKGEKGKGVKPTSGKNTAAGDSSSQHLSYADSTGLTRPAITVVGSKTSQAMMYDAKGTLRDIVFICHQCHMCHYANKSRCMACDTIRDPGLEPTVYDPKLHKACTVQKSKVPAASASTHPSSSPDQEPNPAQVPKQDGPAAALFPQDWNEGDALSEEELITEDATMDEPKAPEAPENAQGLADQEALASWAPACLTKAAIRLCQREGCQEVLKYKHLFGVGELAESELTQEIDLQRRRLASMQLSPCDWVQDIALAQQRIAQLEEKRAKEDASVQGSGEQSTSVGRLQIVLGNHLQNIAKEEHEHLGLVADFESKISTLQAEMAQAERHHSLKTSANETLRAELQSRVNAMNGPQHLLHTIQAEQATEKVQHLTDSAFSPEWLSQQGLSNIATAEVLKVLVAQAMTVARQAQTMGIQITPPQDPNAPNPLATLAGMAPIQLQVPQHIAPGPQQHRTAAPGPTVPAAQGGTPATALPSGSFGPSPGDTQAAMQNTTATARERERSPYGRA